MVDETWYDKIESYILTILKYELVQKSSAPFPKLTCTTSNQEESLEFVGNFPTMYVHMLPPYEVGRDLTNENVNGISCTFELIAYSDNSEKECRQIITAGIKQMKKLHFNVETFPDPRTSDKKYIAITRLNRVIASGDKELVPQSE
ncbi:hypothetical protein [Pseudobutyrivibrio sp.]|uniref:hypothetical protein n=1 Tax=Pseudobutyrivibrio sp. TaxID=2014367 RepID=UPI0038633E19